ncbi:hypothetical protein [Streptomyces albofaciens]|uniref:hypothetical protein n=1 Tax=Streptomyces albofaciens TaxID=66866 RepID=UPI00123C36F6|nr:hypothetical protein [Streptomyces albofaciens]
MTTTTWGRSAFIAGPGCMAAYGLIRLVDTERGPGLAWSVGHLFLLAGVLLFVPVLLGLRRLAVRQGGTQRAVGTGLTALGLVGVAAVAVQAGIDLLVAYVSADHEAMRELFARIQGVPGVMPAVYTVVPVLFYVGLLLLLGQLAALRVISAWRPLAVVVGTVAMTATLDLLPVAALLFLLALAPLGRLVPTGQAGAVRSAGWGTAGG